MVGTFLVLTILTGVHRRVGLRPQPHDRDGPGPRRSTTACSSSPATGRSWPPGRLDGGRAGPHDADRGSHGRVQRRLTVAVSLAALLLFPIPYVQSFAYAGVGRGRRWPRVGHRLAARRARRPRPPGREGQALPPARPQPGRGLLAPPGHRVMAPPDPVRGRRSSPSCSSWPSRSSASRRALVDDRVLPEDATSRAALDDLRTEFGGAETGGPAVVAARRRARRTTSTRTPTALSGVPDVVRVDARDRLATPDGKQLVPPIVPNELLARFRPRRRRAPGCRSCPTWSRSRRRARSWSTASGPSPAPVDVLVGGTVGRAGRHQGRHPARLPCALASIAGVTFVLLFLMVGQPARAAQGAGPEHAVSLTATFGAMVWVFQEGHLADLLDFTPTGSSTSPRRC